MHSGCVISGWRIPGFRAFATAAAQSARGCWPAAKQLVAPSGPAAISCCSSCTNVCYASSWCLLVASSSPTSFTLAVMLEQCRFSHTHTQRKVSDFTATGSCNTPSTCVAVGAKHVDSSHSQPVTCISEKCTHIPSCHRVLPGCTSRWNIGDAEPESDATERARRLEAHVQGETHVRS